MLKLVKNKRGFSLAEMLAAIVIVGVASTTITSMIITSYRGQIRAQQYLLANEIAKTYDAVLARDINREKLKDKYAILKPADDATDKYYTFDNTDEKKLLLQYITQRSDGTNSEIYNYLYGSGEGKLQLNDTVYDINNVSIRLYVISANVYSYFKTEITVTYSNTRQVTYSGTHFSDLSQ